MTDRCVACDTSPPFVPGMSLCRACLKARVDAGRAEREARWARQRQKAPDAEAIRDWQQPLAEPEGKP